VLDTLTLIVLVRQPERTEEAIVAAVSPEMTLTLPVP